MGLRHDRYTSGVPRTGFRYGYVNQRAFEPDAPVSARWRTIMAYNGQCSYVGGFHCPRIPYFSNPDKTYNGDPMGVPVDHPSTGADGPADAVRGLNDRREITANYRPSSTSPTPRVALALSPYWLSENGGVTTLTATLHRPSSEDTILTVSVSPSDAVTLSGDGTLIIPAGETVSVDSVTINGVDNDHQTGDSTLTVSATATNMSSQGVFGPESVELTIIDDETTPAVTLSLSPAKVRVGGEPVLVSAALDNRSIAETTVTLSASPAEAVDIAPVDLIIPAGQKESKDFVVVRTMDDGDITESRKSVTVSGAATNPQGVTGPGSVELKIFPDGVAFFADDSISYTFTAGVPAGRVLPKAMNSNGPLTYSLTPTPTNGVTFVSGPPARLIVSATAIVADVSSYTLTVTDGDGDTDTMAVSFTFVEGVCLDSAAVSGYSNPGIVADCEGLLTFMDALRGRRSLNWSEHLPINTWQGVSIAKNRVVGIELSLEDLSGTIPSELVSLSELQFLHLPYNSLTGEIPPELGDLANLQSLDIRANELTGEVPSELGGLGNLNVLRLDTNKLTGEIPSELGGLSNLEELRLSGNALTGEIPPELGGLNNLQVLGLHSNQLTGGIPVWLATLQDLQSLFLDFNSLTGSIPVELSSLTNLQNLDLSENQLTGPVPTELSDLTKLQILGLKSNQLTGPVPTELSDLTKLQILGLKSNQLTGPIPTELGDLTKLKVLDILANQLTGPIPTELGNLADLEWLHLSGNQLTGPIPIELGRLANLQYLALSVNQLSGEIPTKLGGLANLRTMGLHENSLTGPIPTELGNLSNLKRLSLNNNELTGPIPPEVVELPNLEELTLKGNRLTGCVPVKLRYVPYTDYKRLDLPFCDVLLEDITIGPGSLIPAFDPYRTDYAVLTSTSRVTVTPVNESNASIRFLDQNGNEIVDADSSQDGHQIDLDTGVTIINIAVTSQDGQTTHTYTIRVADAPGAPTITAVTPGEGYLTISWTAPDDTGGLDIESYDIRYIETAADETVESNWTFVEDVWTATSGDDLQYSITGLTGETPYDIQVRAENAKGIGPWSETMTGTPAAPSVCVTGGAVEDATNTGLTSGCEALLVARDNLAGSGATRSLNWASDTPLSQWYGVVLSGTPERVTQLRLHGQNGNPERGLSEAKLNGTIPPELGRLSDLQVLYLHRNNLTGEVPGTLNSLSKLRLLYLYDNGLTGISDELGPGMTELRRLFAQRNDLTGEIPSGLGSMTNLDWLTLYSNQLTGEIPAELGGLTRLKRLYVHENGLTGEIPKELAGVSSLTHLLLHRNALTGKVSSELGGLTNLEWLSLYDNKLDGSIPSALGDLSSLEVLYLHGNDLEGPVPSELGNLTAMTNLWLKDNMLSGEIPRELGDLSSLVRVRISGNDFTGCIPAGLTDDEETGRTSDAESLGLDVCEDS